MSETKAGRSGRTSVIVLVLAALLGLSAGVAAALFISSRGGHTYVAESMIAVVPPPDASAEAVSSYWEVLTRGQVNRIAAVIYEDPRWLPGAGVAAGVPASDLQLRAGAIPETSLIQVEVQANSSSAAQAALDEVLLAAGAEARSLAAPFMLRTASPPETTEVQPLGSRNQLMATFGVAGALAGVGVSFVVRSLPFGRRTRVEKPHSHARMPRVPDADRSGTAGSAGVAQGLGTDTRR